MLRVEQQRTIAYFQHLSSLATAAAANMQAQQSELVDNLPEVSPAADVRVAGSWLPWGGTPCGWVLSSWSGAVLVPHTVC
jgi:hypothetical protein